MFPFRSRVITTEQAEPLRAVCHFAGHHKALLGGDHPNLHRRVWGGDRRFTVHRFAIPSVVQDSAAPAKMVKDPFAENGRILPDATTHHNGFRSAQRSQIRSDVFPNAITARLYPFSRSLWPSAE